MVRSVLLGALASALVLVACAPRPWPGPAPAEAARLLGRDVWAYGGGPFKCVLPGRTVTGRLSVDTAIRVVGADVARRPQLVEIGVFGHRPAVGVQRPLVLTLRPATGFPTFASATGRLATFEAPLVGRDCQTFKVAFADLAHLRRTVSPAPPPTEVRRALAVHLSTGSALGLTHEEALWLYGPPDEPLGDMDALLRAPTWTVLGPPGHGDWTVTFRGDRVLGETRPQPMP